MKWRDFTHRKITTLERRRPSESFGNRNFFFSSQDKLFSSVCRNYEMRNELSGIRQNFTFVFSHATPMPNFPYNRNTCRDFEIPELFPPSFRLSLFLKPLLHEEISCGNFYFSHTVKANTLAFQEMYLPRKNCPILLVYMDE
jgi:hypothetical protein